MTTTNATTDRTATGYEVVPVTDGFVITRHGRSLPGKKHVYTSKKNAVRAMRRLDAIATPAPVTAPAKTSTPKVLRTSSDTADAILAIANGEATSDEFVAPTASTDRLERIELAKAEHAAVKAWEDAGSKGNRPLTPNIDAMTSGAPTGKSGTGKATVASTRNPRYNECLAVKRQGPRGKGTAVTDDEVRAHIVAVRKERTDTTMRQECEIAYWLHGMSVTWRRFGPIWDEVIAAESAPAKRTTRAAKATKATA